MTSEQAVSLAAQVTMKAVENSTGFVIGNEDEPKAVAAFMDAIFEKIRELNGRPLRRA